MRSTTGTPEFVIFGAGLLLYALLLWSLHRRLLKKIDWIFSKGSTNEPSHAVICEAMDELNQDSAHFVFTVDRHANILFRQDKITLLYGHVGTRTPGGIRGPVWTLRKRVFALVDKDGTESIKNASSIFRYAMSGYSYSVFWVNLDALMREFNPATHPEH